MKKAIIYPYNVLVTELIRYRDLTEDFEIVAAVSPVGIGTEGVDCASLDNGEETELYITHNYAGALDKCDTVIIAEYSFCFFSSVDDFERIVYDKVMEAMKRGKNIVSMHSFSNYENLYRAAEKYNVNYKVIAEMQQIEDIYYTQNPDFMSLHNIDVPIITIVGLHEETNKFGIQLELRKLFMKSNIKILQVGSKQYCELLGFYSFPSVMLDNRLSEERKIIYFNHFLYNLVKKEMPDVIIIGIPGGIVPISMRLHQHFGILVYEVGCSIQSDYTILTIPAISTNNFDFNNIGELLASKLGCTYNCIAMSNNTIDYNDLFSEYRIANYNRYNIETVDEILSHNESYNLIYNAASTKGKFEIFREIQSNWPELFAIKKEPSNLIIQDNKEWNIKEWLIEVMRKYFGDKELSALMPYEYLYLHTAILQKYNVGPTKKHIESGCYKTIDNLEMCIRQLLT